MQTPASSPWKQAVQAGLIAGAIAVLLSLVGMVASFSERFIVSGVFTMGQVIFLAPMLLMSYSVLRRTAPQPPQKVILSGLLTGLLGGVVLAALVLIGKTINLQVMFINSSPELHKILTFDQELIPGLLILLVISMVMGLLASGIFLLPKRLTPAVIQGLIWVLMVGLLRDLILTVTSRWGPLAGLSKSLFALSGLKPVSAVLLFALIAGLSFWRSGRPAAAKSRVQTKQSPLVLWSKWIGIIVLLLLLPPILGIFFSDILDTVMMYILMGIGLNIVVGFAGLLDLGYVAFFAIGAYTMGVLTSPELNANPLTYWQALPFAMVACVLAGFILGSAGVEDAR